ncbi:GGDEF domain-containing protein [Falsirhodobacter deserti]|uniref:GGDEF domain-containing protein n=1 Tax=Falsirhodobacter deserti TaxID=1365611 RepID=UPI000FE2A014|nr:GGDEF domain-containing protein [Falsirhodobacter deserti]
MEAQGDIGMTERAEGFTISAALIDALLPMSVLVQAGRVRHVGPLARHVLLLEVGHPLDIPDGLSSQPFLLDLPSGTVTALSFVLPDGVLLSLSLANDVARIMSLPAQGFSPLDSAPALLVALRRALAEADDLRQINDQLLGAKTIAEEEAMTDPLTGLANRRAMDRVLTRIASARLPFALLRMDLDHFKAVNDTFGHAAGDHVLQSVAQVLTQETRDTDFLSRMGGDEFTLLFPGTPDPAQVQAITTRILDRLAEPIVAGTDSYRISASIGATLSSYYNAPDPARMMEEADQALYMAKREGRGCMRLARM